MAENLAQEQQLEQYERLPSNAHYLPDSDRFGPDENAPLLDAASPTKWWQKPSPAFLMSGVFLMPLCLAGGIGPRLEVYNLLICRTIGSSGAYAQDLPDISTPITVVSPWVPNWLAAGDMDADLCRHSPEVQRRAATLLTSMTMTLGILSCLMTNYYSVLSARKGRTLILATNIAGFATSELCFLLTVYFVETLGYHFILVGAVLEGLAGGLATMMALASAYISDCTPTGSRAKIFSMFTGVVFAGFALGPVLGGLLVKHTNNLIAPMYCSFLALIVCSAYISVIVPESVSPAKQQEAEVAHQQKLTTWQEQGKSSLRFRLKRSLHFFEPLGILLPRSSADEDLQVGRSWRHRWALALVALAYATYSSLAGIYSVKMLYAQFKFNFGPLENGYYLTTMAACKVVFLVLILPLVIRLVRSKKIEPLSKREEEMTEVEKQQKARLVLRDSYFDLRLARASVAIDIVAYTSLIFTNNAWYFVACALITSFGSGAAPAMQSLALSLAPPHENAKVLGALSVLNSLTGSALGPFLFGVLWLKTLDRLPEAIFAAGSLFFIACLLCLSLVRLRSLGPRDPVVA